MPPLSPSVPGGYVSYVHEMAVSPRYTQHPTVSGGSVTVEHGKMQKKLVVVRYAQADEIESVVAAEETDGYTRSSPLPTQYEIGPEIALYRVEAELIKYMES